MSIEKNLQEIIDVIANGIQTGIENLKDGFQYTDLFAFVPVLSQIPNAITDADHALNYLKDMDAQKRQDLIDAVVAKLNNENARETATRIIDAAAANYMLYLHLSKKAGETA